MCDEQNMRYKMGRIHGHHGMGKMHGPHSMDCCRSFLTKEEQVEMLKHYKEWLEKEAKGVTEYIEKLEKAS